MRTVIRRTYFLTFILWMLTTILLICFSQCVKKDIVSPSSPINILFRPFHIADNLFGSINSYLTTKVGLSNITDTVQQRAFSLLHNTSVRLSEATKVQEILEPEIKDAIKNPAVRADIVKQVLSIVTAVVQLPRDTKSRKTASTTSNTTTTSTTKTPVFTAVPQYSIVQNPILVPYNSFPETIVPIHTIASPVVGNPTVKGTETSSWQSMIAMAPQSQSYSEIATKPTVKQGFVRQLSSDIINMTKEIEKSNKIFLLTNSFVTTEELGLYSTIENYIELLQNQTAKSALLHIDDGLIKEKLVKRANFRFSTLAPLPIEPASVKKALTLLCQGIMLLFPSKTPENFTPIYIWYIEALAAQRFQYTPHVFASMALNLMQFMNQTQNLGIPSSEIFHVGKLASLLFFRDSDHPEEYARIAKDYIKVVYSLHVYKQFKKFLTQSDAQMLPTDQIPLLSNSYPSLSSLVEELETLIFRHRLFNTDKIARIANYFNKSVFLKQLKKNEADIISQENNEKIQKKYFEDLMNLLLLYESKGADIHAIWLNDVFGSKVTRPLWNVA
jgi:hypothetical protein